MTEIKESDFVAEPEKTFAELFNHRGCPKCGKGYIWQLEHRNLPDCSNVLCNWKREKRILE